MKKIKQGSTVARVFEESRTVMDCGNPLVFLRKPNARPLLAPLVRYCIPGLTFCNIALSGAAYAACSNTAPDSGQTASCDTTPPNPTTTNIKSVPGSTNVAVDIGAGSGLSVTRTISPVVVSVDSGSQITNDGTISLSGGGGSGGNRGAAMLGTNDNNRLTNGLLGIITTVGAYNDGMGANGSGNTLTNAGTITTSGPFAYGMTAAWGQTNTGQANNSIINNGTVTTSGSNARAASILGSNGVISNTGTLQTSGNNSTAVYMQGNNDRLTNSGTIHASGLGAEGVFSNTAGSCFTATIENQFGGKIISDRGPALRTLNGATGITNAGLLSGGNGTALNGGNGNITFVLQTGSEIIGLANGGAGSNLVRLEGSGTIANPFANFQTLTMEGSDWTWNGSGTFADTFINSGTFRLQNSLTGNVAIAAGTSLLAGNGANPSIAPFPGGPPITVTNAGLIDLSNGSSSTANSLTIVGNYVGNNGRLNLHTVLGPDNSPSDKLVISGGAASGTTTIGVTNRGGSGGLTVDSGILLVQTTNGATTSPTAFALNGGSLAAGAYQYYLFHGGVTAGTENNWYLRSSIPPPPPTGPPSESSPPPPATPPVAAPNTPPLPPPAAIGTPPLPPSTTPGAPPATQPTNEAAPVPLFRPQAALYSAIPFVARELGVANLGTFHDRQGDQALLDGRGAFAGGWARAYGQHTNQQWSGAANPSFNGSLIGIQSGFDLFGWTSANSHRDRVGFFGAYGRASGNVRGFAGGFMDAAVGSLSIDATSAGGYWTHIGPTGWYIDAVAMHTWYQHSPRAIDGLSTRADGTGQIVSLEGGYPVRVGPHLTIEPQAQVIYQHLSLDPMRDLVSPVSYGGSDAVSGRIGMRLTGDFQTMSGSILQPYLKANVWRTFGGWDSVTFGGTDLIQTQRMATAMEIGGGIVAKLNDDLGIFASAAFITNLDGARRNTVQANVGLRASW